MKEISSRTNDLIKHVASLQQRRPRNKHQEFIAEGSRACTTLIKSGVTLKHLFILEKMKEDAEHIASDEQIVMVPEHVMEKMSAASTPSGMLGQFAMPSKPDPENLQPGLVLGQISDPGNMGTLIRTSVALNRQSIVIVEGADPYSPKVVQASAGTIGMVDLFQWSWPELIAHKKDMPLAAMIVAGGKAPSETNPESLLVVGSEAHGIPEEWIKECDQKLTLSMPGDAESLNAAVAGSIALYLLSSNN